MKRAGSREAETWPGGGKWTPSVRAVCGYQPVVGGVRHLTWLPAEPSAGTVVDLLCGKQYQVARRRKSTPIYECSACDEEYREKLGLPSRHQVRSAERLGSRGE